MSKCPNVADEIDIYSSRWAKILFARMNFVKRRKTSSKVDIPEGPDKEIEFIFLHDIVSKVEKYNIPSALPSISTKLQLNTFQLAMKPLQHKASIQ